MFDESLVLIAKVRVEPDIEEPGDLIDAGTRTCSLRLQEPRDVARERSVARGVFTRSWVCRALHQGLLGLEVRLRVAHDALERRRSSSSLLAEKGARVQIVDHEVESAMLLIDFKVTGFKPAMPANVPQLVPLLPSGCACLVVRPLTGPLHVSTLREYFSTINLGN
jgi:hypothetical protein